MINMNKLIGIFSCLMCVLAIKIIVTEIYYVGFANENVIELILISLMFILSLIFVIKS